MHFESMEENPCEIQRRGGAGGHAKRYPADDDKEEEEEFCGTIECSGKSCGSCTAGLIADCVAVCCCPCAVVNILALAFLKVPWMMGRKCLGLGKKNKKKKRKLRKCCANARSRIKEMEEHHEWEIRMDMDGIMRKEGGEEGTIVSGIGRGEEQEDEEEEEEGETDTAYSARFEAEKVWLELYQVGHLGFGRVSFTGIQSMAKGN